jgi:inner membrane protein
VALTALGLCVVRQGVLQRQALELGRTAAQAHGLSVERLSAVAQPFSPFNWKPIAVEGDLYHEARLNLAGHPPLVPRLPGLGPLRAIAGSYRPPAELRWRTRPRDGDRPELHGLVAERWADPRFEPFRRFAVYPSLSRVDGGGTGACIWFTDLRYDLPALPDTFRYGFCRDACDLPWRLHRLRYFWQRSGQPVPT